MRLLNTVSIVAMATAGALVTNGLLANGAFAQAVNTTPANVNVLNLLSPYLGLNVTTVGQQTLSLNLSQAIATNNNATPLLQQLAISDKNLFGGRTNTITLANGTTATYGVAANLAGGLPAQAAVTGTNGSITPIQPVGGLGAVLGPIFQTGVRPIGTGVATTAILANTANLLVNTYNFTSSDLGVAKNYFANGAATNPSTTPAGYVPVPAVAPAGYTLPTANGLPNTTNSVYDLAAGVTNTQAGQDVYGSSRPVQVAPAATSTAAGINQFDSTSIAGLSTNPSFPSGHTNYAYTDSVLIAMLVPQDYQSMLARASAYGNSRIVLGVHYPLDIIASRAFSAYDLAQAFTNPLYVNNAATTGTALNLPTLFNAANTELQPYLATNCGGTVAACSTSAANTANDPYVPSAALAASVVANLTYGLPTLTLAQAPQEAAPTGGPDASILLAPLYGGTTTAATTIAPNGGINGSLSTATINQIVVNTENVALAAFYGTNLSYWTRINLYAAAGYFQGVTGTLSLATTDKVTTNVTIANTGILEANGTITGTTTVNSGGTLAGSGTVAGVTVASGGTVAAGSLATIGTLTVAGPIAFAAGSADIIRATAAGQNDTIAASGAAMLAGGTVAVKTGGGFMPQTYRILTAAGGVTGTFTNSTADLIFASSTLSYDANDAFVTLGRNNAAFVGAAATPNQAAVAQGLANAGMSATTNSNVVLNALFSMPTAAQAQGAFDQLSGEGLVATETLNIHAGRAFSETISDQLALYRNAPSVAPIRELADLPSNGRLPLAPIVAQPTRYRVWASGFGGNQRISANSLPGVAGQTGDFFGGVVGADYQMQPGMLLGVALGGSGTDFTVASRATTGSATGFHAAAYGSAQFEANYILGEIDFSDFSNRTNRLVGGFAGFGVANERASFGSNEIRGRLEAGHAFSFDRGFGSSVASITPFVAIEGARLATGGFSEYNTNGVGNLLGVTSGGKTTTDIPGFIGLRFDGAMSFGGLQIRPVASVAYLHDFAIQRNLVNGLISLPGSTFLVQGARPAHDAAQVKLGGETSIGRNMTLFANFDGEFSGVETVYGGKGGLRVTW